MKQTLFEIVEDLLSSLSSDYVASIHDTDEALRVAQAVKSVYNALGTTRNWPHKLSSFQLTPFSDNMFPTHMRIEYDVNRLQSVYYNKAGVRDTKLLYQPIKYVTPDDFLRVSNQRNTDNPNTLVVNDTSGIQLLILNNKHPEYFTSLNEDSIIVFDSYDSAVDASLQASKIQATGYAYLSRFQMQDDWIPDLPMEAFPLLIEEAKSRVFLEIKGEPNQKAEQESQRQNRWLSQKAERVNELPLYPANFGRRGNHYRKDPTFRKE